ncbi:acyltransferase family protein [Georgenia sunbinii]|uniref:acyltransferase family protein n=1 Tax=Georgenia sunbinii TaxID=3117728 RepID=UPI002F26BB17
MPERRYLPELHGVRGFALLGVVLFHLFGDGRVSGGIDIFLAVSGFLFTGMLLREAAATRGHIDPLKYYGRLVRRILVPAAVVLAATLLIGLLISPVTKHNQLWAEARASLLYYENVELISSQLAYGAAGPETSPFQHFWSLSVQGQFYVVWPALAIVAVLSAKRLKISAARSMAIFVGIVFIASFGHAIVVSSYNHDEAYLLTTTRGWQLAFGGLLALVGGTVRLPRPLRAPAGWVGLALIVSCGFVLDGAQLFPGPWALWPLVGLTLVLMSGGSDGGNNDPRGTATRFLSNGALSWVGDHAYGLYLWHWPLTIFYMEILDRDAIGLRGALVILAVTVALAMLTYKYIETPLKNRQQQRSTATARTVNKYVVAIAAGALVVAGTGATAVLDRPQHQTADVFADWDWENYPGALVTTPAYAGTAAADDYLPAVADLAAQRATVYEDGCVQDLGNNPGLDEVKVCEDPNKPDDPTATVVISGGSHSVHWHAAIEALAAEYRWELLVVTKDACTFMVSEDPDSASCQSWNDNYIDWLATEDVDLVIANGTRIFSAAPERIQEGAPHRWQQITDTGAELALVRGTPRPGKRVDDCLASGQTPVECGATADQIADTNPLEDQDLPAGTHIIDMLPHVCPDGMSTGSGACPAVVGNVVVWYDGSHLTNRYVATLTPLIEAELREPVGWLFERSH